MSDRILSYHISPEPSGEEQEAILKAVRLVLEREAERARPATWSLGGWTHKRAGVRDFGGWLPAGRRWALSARLPQGGRDHVGLIGRGDAK